jgi:hypothetical protein
MNSNRIARAEPRRHGAHPARSSMALGLATLLGAAGCASSTPPAADDVIAPTGSTSRTPATNPGPIAPPDASDVPSASASTAPAGSGSCVDDCVRSRQMQAISMEQIKKNCEADCSKR